VPSTPTQPPSRRGPQERAAQPQMMDDCIIARGRLAPMPRCIPYQGAPGRSRGLLNSVANTWCCCNADIVTKE